MKPTYREKNLLDYLFEGIRSTLPISIFLVQSQSSWFLAFPFKVTGFLQASVASK